MKPKQVLPYDTTLRDGAQGQGVDFSPPDMLAIAARLDDFGLPYIEGGWPGANPRVTEFFELAKSYKFKQARLVAFGATRRPGITCDQDKNLRALLAAETPAVAIFGKSWLLHVTEVMRISRTENLAMIRDSVRFLKKRGKEVIYDAEHFFDGFKADPDYALSTLLAALDGGADFLALCETNGGSLPSEIREIVAQVYELLGARGRRFQLGIHAHNDSGLAVANSIEAAQNGAVMIQGTINGFGERAGNADLTAIIPILQLKLGMTCVPAKSLAGLKSLSVFVWETANLAPVIGQPFVGSCAFAHKAGVHVSAVMKDARSYEHIQPERVGNQRRILHSDLSGRGNIRYQAAAMGISLDEGGDTSRKIVQEIKRLEREGFQFDVAQASLEVLVRKLTGGHVPSFELDRFQVTVGNDHGRRTAEAVVKIRVGEQNAHTVANGDGPINALDNALRQALERFYPVLKDVRLVDYKVRVIKDGSRGTASKVRVSITTGDYKNSWDTVGVSTDVIEASWMALVDGYEWKLGQRKK